MIYDWKTTLLLDVYWCKTFANISRFSELKFLRTKNEAANYLCDGNRVHE